jgi:hypothetical protein
MAAWPERTHTGEAAPGWEVPAPSAAGRGAPEAGSPGGRLSHGRTMAAGRARLARGGRRQVPGRPTGPGTGTQEAWLADELRNRRVAGELDHPGALPFAAD